MVPLRRLIECGSLTNTEDLNRLVKALDKRVNSIRRKLKEPKSNTNLLLDELNRANIYREEFNYLRNQL